MSEKQILHRMKVGAVIYKSVLVADANAVKPVLSSQKMAV